MGYLSGWANRIELTIDSTKINSILYDFPILITVSSGSGITNSNITGVFDELESNDNRKKIAVTTSDGTTQCPVEIERWDHTNKKAYLWTKVPEISDSVYTVLYLYYDSTQNNNTSYVGDTTDLPAQDVWSNDYSFVAHLSTRYDSTTSGTQISSDGDYVTASIARGVWLDGANSEYLSCSTVISGSSYTFETFFKTSDIGKIILKDATTSPMNITLTSGTLDFSISRTSTGKINNEGMSHSCYNVSGGACNNTSDSSSATYWVSTSPTATWNRVDLGIGVTKAIKEVQLQGFGYAERMVNSFKIFGSNNDSDWDELYSGNAVENLNLQTYTFNNPSILYRYYRFNSYGIFGAGNLQMSKIHYIENTVYSVSKTGTYNDNEYHFLTAVRRSNNNDLFLFVDGQTVSGTTGPGNYSNAADPLLLGGITDDYNTITFDEVRSSEIVRSRSWIEATYYSNTDNLITFDNPPLWYYYGYITENDNPVSRKVNLYNNNTGELVGTATSSDSNGYYYLTTTISGEHFIIVFDDDIGEDYNALILDKLLPRGIE